jgi:hypothetical protein
VTSFMHLSTAFSNQRFINCSPTVDAGFENIMSDSFCVNGLQAEYIFSFSVSCASVVL